MGVSLMKLEPNEKLLAMTLVDERGVIASGTGRSGKAREVQITRKSFEEFVMHRARKGRQIAVSWRVENLAPIMAPGDKGTEGGESSASNTGLSIQLEDESPRLL